MPTQISIDRTSTHFSRPRIYSWLLSAILLLALTLRLNGITREKDWTEILLYDAVGGGPFSLIMTRAYPLGYLFTYLTLRLGDIEFYLRFSSVAAGIAGVLLIWNVTSRVSNSTAGLLSALMLAVSSEQIFHSQHAGFETLLSAALLLSLWLLFEALHSGSRRSWTLFSASVLAGLLIHPFYLAAQTSLVVGAIAWVLISKRASQSARATIAMLLAAGLLPAIVVRLLQFAAGIEVTAMYSTGIPAAQIASPWAVNNLFSCTNNLFSWIAGVLFLVIACVGVARIIIFDKLSACIVLMGLFGPALMLVLPSLSMETRAALRSWQCTLLTILVAIGTITVFESVQRRWKLDPVVSRALLCSMVLVCAIAFWSATRDVNTRRTTTGFREMASHIIARSTASDRLVYLSNHKAAMEVPSYSSARTDGDPASIELDHYLHLAQQFDTVPFYPLHQRFVSNPRMLLEEMEKHPTAAFWCVTDTAPQSSTDFPGWEALLRKEVSSSGYNLWVRGEPTVNLLASESNRGPIKCTGATTVSIAVKPPQRRLRNSSFELWTSGLPMGWRANFPDAVTTAPTAGKGQHSVMLRGTSQPLELEQKLTLGAAPGNHVAVRALGRATAPDLLSFILRYSGDEGTSEIQAWHPGTGDWAPVELHAHIPNSAYPSSCRIVVRRELNTTEAAFVDDVTVEIVPPCEVLEPGKAHTLSGRIKYFGIPPDDFKTKAGIPVMNPATAGFISISGKRADGTQFDRKVLMVDGHSDWKAVGFNLPASDLDLASARELFVNCGAGHPHGTFYFNEMQLEVNDHATPYTPDERLPHDEALALTRGKL
ncbi:MAG: glycosyltransferase family 39 protein [Candidatus Sumerlaeaceae bacterium]